MCPESEFQNLSFLVLRRKPCRCQDFTIVFVLLFSVAVAVSTHLCVVCRHFCCPMSLFQGRFASVSKFSLTGPQETGQNKCINGDAPKGGATQNTIVVCMGLMGLKSENEKGSVKIRRCP